MKYILFLLFMIGSVNSLSYIKTYDGECTTGSTEVVKFEGDGDNDCTGDNSDCILNCAQACADYPSFIITFVSSDPGRCFCEDKTTADCTTFSDNAYDKYDFVPLINPVYLFDGYCSTYGSHSGGQWLYTIEECDTYCRIFGENEEQKTRFVFKPDSGPTGSACWCGHNGGDSPSECDSSGVASTTTYKTYATTGAICTTEDIYEDDSGDPDGSMTEAECEAWATENPDVDWEYGGSWGPRVDDPTGCFIESDGGVFFNRYANTAVCGGGGDNCIKKSAWKYAYEDDSGTIEGPGGSMNEAECKAFGESIGAWGRADSWTGSGGNPPGCFQDTGNIYFNRETSNDCTACGCNGDNCVKKPIHVIEVGSGDPDGSMTAVECQAWAERTGETWNGFLEDTVDPIGCMRANNEKIYYNNDQNSNACGSGNVKCIKKVVCNGYEHMADGYCEDQAGIDASEVIGNGVSLDNCYLQCINHQHFIYKESSSTCYCSYTDDPSECSSNNWCEYPHAGGCTDYKSYNNLLLSDDSSSGGDSGGDAATAPNLNPDAVTCLAGNGPGTVIKSEYFENTLNEEFYHQDAHSDEWKLDCSEKIGSGGPKDRPLSTDVEVVMDLGGALTVTSVTITPEHVEICPDYLCYTEYTMESFLGANGNYHPGVTCTDCYTGQWDGSYSTCSCANDNVANSVKITGTLEPTEYCQKRTDAEFQGGDFTVNVHYDGCVACVNSYSVSGEACIPHSTSCPIGEGLVGGSAYEDKTCSACTGDTYNADGTVCGACASACGSGQTEYQACTASQNRICIDDVDGDGVADGADNCDNTEANNWDQRIYQVVSECEYDCICTSGDEATDCDGPGQSKCETCDPWYTPDGSGGCISDSDADGIEDNLDLCDDTAANNFDGHTDNVACTYDCLCPNGQHATDCTDTGQSGCSGCDGDRFVYSDECKSCAELKTAYEADSGDCTQLKQKYKSENCCN